MVEIKREIKLDILELYDLLNNDKYSEEFRDELSKKLLGSKVEDDDGYGFSIEDGGIRGIKIKSINDKFKINFNYSEDERKEFIITLNKGINKVSDRLLKNLVDIKLGRNGEIISLKFKSSGLQSKSRVGKLFESMTKMIILCAKLRSEGSFEIMTPLMKEKYKYMGFNEEEYNYIKSYDNDNIYNLRKVMFENLYVWCLYLDNQEGLNKNIDDEIDIFNLFEIEKSSFKTKLNEIYSYFKERECN